MPDRYFEPMSTAPQTPPENNLPEPNEPAFGWTSYAEQVNGRFAMVGFIFLIVLEFFTKQDLFSWLGLR
jgi:Chlorophyll A-B binding protein